MGLIRYGMQQNLPAKGATPLRPVQTPEPEAVLVGADDTDGIETATDVRETQKSSGLLERLRGFFKDFF